MTAQAEYRQRYAALITPPANDVRLIGLCGYARSGKNATGQILEDDYGFRQVSFAQALKNVAASLNPLLPGAGPERSSFTLAAAFRHYGGWDTVKENVPAAREFLQNLGVACREQIDEDVWVDALFNRIEASDPATSRFVITDCRFPNEVAAVRRRGGQVWRIERPGTGPVNSHISESALPLDPQFYDRYVLNDGSLADLRRRVLTSA